MFLALGPARKKSQETIQKYCLNVQETESKIKAPKWCSSATHPKCCPVACGDLIQEL